jgi:hypothetical protein
MKGTIFTVIRLILFIGILILLPKMVTKAQFIDACSTFTAPTSSPCPNCCTARGEVPEEPFVTGAGTDGLTSTAWSCGTAVKTGCSVACTGSTEVASSDANCCLTTGQACSTTSQCCGSPGDSCEGGTCTASCLPVGSNCSTDDDCCGSLACDSGVCTNEDGGGGGGGGGGGCDDGSGTCGCDDLIRASLKQSLVLGMSTGGGAAPRPDECSDIVTVSTKIGTGYVVLPAADGLVHSDRQFLTSSANSSSLTNLAAFDLPANGGNGDGIIDSRDLIYSHLRVWIDANHDGVAQPGELHALSSLGTFSISLNRSLSQKTGRLPNLNSTGIR